MNDSHLQLALREWRAHMRQPVTLVSLAGAGVVAGLAGPFGTGEVAGFGVRLIYWLAMVVLGYSAGFLVNATLLPPLAKRPVWLATAITGNLTGLLVFLIVLGMNAVVLGHVPRLASLPTLLVTILAVAWIVTVMLYIANSQGSGAQPPPDAVATPALLTRLPFEKRGALLALSVEDHYVRVYTDKGTEMLLMRLSDAMRETAPEDGAQVHRSHWVAWSAVQAARREGDRAILTLTNGQEIPVSRANMARIREAGLLPR